MPPPDRIPVHFFVRLRDWKVGTRLAFGFGLILTLLCVVALLGMLASSAAARCTWLKTL